MGGPLVSLKQRGLVVLHLLGGILKKGLCGKAGFNHWGESALHVHTLVYHN